MALSSHYYSLPFHSGGKKDSYSGMWHLYGWIFKPKCNMTIEDVQRFISAYRNNVTPIWLFISEEDHKLSDLKYPNLYACVQFY